MLDLISFLIEKTPFLAGGFLKNIVISLVAMVLGTVLGTMIAVPIARRWGLVRWLSGLSINLTRNVPSFVLMFYIVNMILNSVH